MIIKKGNYMKKAILYLLIGAFALNSTINVHAFEKPREEQQKKPILTESVKMGYTIAAFIATMILLVIASTYYALRKQPQTPETIRQEQKAAKEFIITSRIKEQLENRQASK